MDGRTDDDSRAKTDNDELPPEGVVYAWEWREAQRLRALHQRQIAHGRPECGHCAQEWPCTGIQVADFAEARARGERPTPPWIAWQQDEDFWQSRRAVGRAQVQTDATPDR